MNHYQDRRSCAVQKGNSCPVCLSNAAERDETAAVRADAAEERSDTKVRRANHFSDPVCVNSNQIYDSCRDRDCVADQRVYLTAEGQELLEQAINVKLKKAEVIWVFTDVEPLSFHRGYFSVDLKFFVCTTLEIFRGVSNPTIVHGLTTYDKRIILYGSEGNSKLFSSRFNPNENSSIAETWQKTNMPTVTVEVVEPVALTAKIVDEDCCGCSCDCGCDCGCDAAASANCSCGCDIFPETICSCFDDSLVIDDCARKVLVTYGLFFIVRLERDTQLLIDAVDFCIPTQECPSATEESPCALFNDIRFPIDEFFPPQKPKEGNGSGFGCGCNN